MLDTRSPLSLAPAARSQMYALLVNVFQPPTATILLDLQGKQVDQTIQQYLATMAAANAVSTVNGAWQDVQHDFPLYTAADYEAEYLRLFEVGVPKAPCPLYESAYGQEDRRREVMGEMVRFYHCFGLSLGARAKELPDHLHVQLECLHYLTFLEAQALEEEQDPQSLLLAQSDLFERHLMVWTPQLWGRLEKLPSRIFKHWGQLTERYLLAEESYLRERL